MKGDVRKPAGLLHHHFWTLAQHTQSHVRKKCEPYVSVDLAGTMQFKMGSIRFRHVFCAAAANFVSQTSLTEWCGDDG